MKKDKHEGCVRAFIHTGEAYYAKTALSGDSVDEISVGMYAPDGGTSGEFMITWTQLGGNVVPALHAFDDGWDALSLFGDLLAEMKRLDNKKVSPAEMCTILRGLGIIDKTPRVSPYRKPDRSEALHTSAASLELLKALRDTLDSLEYIERAHPGLTGCGVRQARIQAARAAIAAATTPTPG